jgi:hypothetical protein
MKLSLLLVAATALASAANEGTTGKVTFTKHVAPILYNRCVECHRKGEVAPMQLISYSEVRPWAKAIKEAVTTRKMPVWLADPHYGKFRNERRLTENEISTITRWVDAGAPEGEARDLPATPKFEEGWVIGKPDAVVYLDKEVDVAAEGVIAYQYYTVQTNFDEDKWVQAAEIRPGNKSVVHHIIVNVLEPGDNNTQVGEGRNAGRGVKLCGFAPGEQPKIYPAGVAKLIKKGSRLVFQMHYTPNGKPAKDRSYIGLIFAKEPPQRKALTATAMNASFVIPANDGNHEVRSSWTAREDVRIIDLMPHMHLRGKDFEYKVVYPDGRSEIILKVPRYDFNWQLLYAFAEPLRLPKGSKIECVAHFDNSANNKFNPDPTKPVRWGPQTWEEMMIGWFEYVLENENLRAAVETK